eukprot:12901664-Prorocentrum_lima.AAC.1
MSAVAPPALSRGHLQRYHRGRPPPQEQATSHPPRGGSQHIRNKLPIIRKQTTQPPSHLRQR